MVLGDIAFPFLLARQEIADLQPLAAPGLEQVGQDPGITHPLPLLAVTERLGGQGELSRGVAPYLPRPEPQGRP